MAARRAKVGRLAMAAQPVVVEAQIRRRDRTRPCPRLRAPPPKTVPRVCANPLRSVLRQPSLAQVALAEPSMRRLKDRCGCSGPLHAPD